MASGGGSWLREHRQPLPGLPELTTLAELSPLRAGDMSLLPHRHPDLEIHYIQRGSLRWWVEDRWYDVPGGTLFLVQPEALHGGYHGLLDPCRLYSLQVAAPDRHHPLGLEAGEAVELGRLLRGRPSQPYRGGPEVERAFRAAMEALDRATDMISTIEVRCAVLQILVAVAKAEPHEAPAHYSEPIARAKALLDERLEDPPPIDKLAAEVGYSASHLKARFREELGIPPAQYSLYQRIHHACGQLARTERPVTAIALEAGFYSSQHFARRFKDVTGLTPTSYRSVARREQTEQADLRLPVRPA